MQRNHEYPKVPEDSPNNLWNLLVLAGTNGFFAFTSKADSMKSLSLVKPSGQAHQPDGKRHETFVGHLEIQKLAG